MPVPSDQTAAACPGCGTALAADQRYCLTCGQPASPVRLAFLDVLAGEQQLSGAATPPIAYTPLLEPSAGPGWLRRYTGLFGVMAVLLVAMLIGLLVGHWVTQSGAPSRQVVEVKGLGAVPAAAAASTTPSSSPAASTTASSTAAKSKAKAEAAEAKAEANETPVEKAPPPKPVKVTPTKLKKLSSTTGRKHQEEINSLGSQPIETGG